MKKLLCMSFIATITSCMAPRAIIFTSKSDSYTSPSCRSRTYAIYKVIKNSHSYRPSNNWKQTFVEYQKALVDREKCKSWKQLGYGMHEGYCLQYSCPCTYRLSLIAQK